MWIYYDSCTLPLFSLHSFSDGCVHDFWQPHSPDNRGLARECKDVKIDRVYIGSCTGGKTEDFIAAAELLAMTVSEIQILNFRLFEYQVSKCLAL